MKKSHLLIVLLVLSMVVVTVGACFAQDFPSSADRPKQVQTSSQQPGNQPFFGYVPPPPIRHTWPGGYKVIFHELVDTLAEHILGQY